jgi:hypothetical protein
MTKRAALRTQALTLLVLTSSALSAASCGPGFHDPRHWGHLTEAFRTQHGTWTYADEPAVVGRSALAALKAGGFTIASIDESAGTILTEPKTLEFSVSVYQPMGMVIGQSHSLALQFLVRIAAAGRRRSRVILEPRAFWNGVERPNPRWNLPRLRQQWNQLLQAIHKGLPANASPDRTSPEFL